MTTKTERKEILFRSLIPHYRLVRIPSRRRYNERGELEQLPGERYEWESGVLKVDAEDADTLDWLRAHEKFNVKFFEVGNEPDRQRPSMEEAMEQISDAAVAADLSALTEIYERERTTYQREAVMRGAQRAIEALEKALAEGGTAPESVSPVEPEEATQE